MFYLYQYCPRVLFLKSNASELCTEIYIESVFLHFPSTRIHIYTYTYIINNLSECAKFEISTELQTSTTQVIYVCDHS